MVFHTLEELGVDIIKSIPSVEDIEAEKFDLTVELMCVGNVSQEKIYEKIMKISRNQKCNSSDQIEEKKE